VRELAGVLLNAQRTGVSESRSLELLENDDMTRGPSIALALSGQFFVKRRVKFRWHGSAEYYRATASPTSPFFSKDGDL
jgi:hypothetical protein